MSLVERASQVIEDGHPSEQLSLILECVNARNVDALAATQRLYEDMYDGVSLNLLLKSPAAHSLVCWGEAGWMLWWKELLALQPVRTFPSHCKYFHPSRRVNLLLILLSEWTILYF